ncbi:MAG TPA: carotenoid 1,2-hydratase [Usitatibacteraceae bacterium]|nr:carotenoid 1,2-hydratase [Usitatibacteraceae bacterium]
MRKPLSFLALLAIAAAALAADYAPVRPGLELAFPADFGAHPEHRIEWWYATGQLDTARGPIGFQVTFFRLRNKEADANPSRFAPRQLLFAHAALADPAHGRLRHDQRIARAFPGIAEARPGDTHVFIDDWSFKRVDGRYLARIPGEGFALDLVLAPTQPLLPQGEAGYSRKGPSPAQASGYYSEPQLAVTGTVKIDGRAIDAKGVAWLDHEWSSEILAGNAVGWDWVGLNLEGGGALMAFRLRDKAGGTVWAGGTLRADGKVRAFSDDEVGFTPRRTWRSPRTGVTWPVQMDFEVAGQLWSLAPLMDDQEMDARGSTGTLYWEGAVTATGPNGAKGRGYLELTGYSERLRF